MENTQEATSEEVKAENAAPHGEQESQDATDWKAEARKWEGYAKKNAKAAEELEKLKREQMTELERAQADAEAAKAEAARLTAEKAMSDKALAISDAQGIPASMLMHCASVEHMEAFAEEWKEFHKQQAPTFAAPTAPQSRIVLGGEQRLSHGDIFASLFQ